MKKSYFTTVVTREGKWFIARCVELGVVSQGRSIEEASSNLKEAVELYTDGHPGAWQFSSAIAPIVTSLEVAHG